MAREDTEQRATTNWGINQSTDDGGDDKNANDPPRRN
jgi:hypothetical protein